jgi:hypothetical protein
MRKKDDLINAVRSKGIAIGILRVIMETICRLIYDFVHGLRSPMPEHPSLGTAVRSQIDIGIRLLPRGFISVKWLHALEDFGVERPAQKFSKLLKMIWFDFTDSLWRNRNKIVHSGDSRTRQHEQETWVSKLRWYLDNTHVISPLDQFVFSYTVEGIQTMLGATRRQLVRNLERLERVYATELRVHVAGQGTLQYYFRVRQADTETGEVNNDDNGEASTGKEDTLTGRM